MEGSSSINGEKKFNPSETTSLLSSSSSSSSNLSSEERRRPVTLDRGTLIYHHQKYYTRLFDEPEKAFVVPQHVIPSGLFFPFDQFSDETEEIEQTVLIFLFFSFFLFFFLSFFLCLFLLSFLSFLNGFFFQRHCLMTSPQREENKKKLKRGNTALPPSFLGLHFPSPFFPVLLPLTYFFFPFLSSFLVPFSSLTECGTQ